MKILIKSRKEIEMLSKKSFPPKTLLISITDTNDTPVKLTNEPEYLIRVAFDDVDNDVIVDEVGENATQEEKLSVEQKYNMISREQAHEIAKTYCSHKDEINTLICQCEYGQSRSAAEQTSPSFQSSSAQEKSKSEDKPSYQGWQSRKVEGI